MKSMQTSTTVETLTSIWQRVLRLPSVGSDDNFFDLGGDSALALELCHEIALACGRELPPVMIYHTPTIAALAAILEQPDTPHVPPVVQLKAGIEDQPVFIAHGLGGSAMDFFQVVKHIETPKTIYGLQAKGIDGAEEPLDRIEDMAHYSLEGIRELQPHGPYLLVGFSLGGLVMFEIAQQLIGEGETIGLLAMLDSYPHVSQLSFGQRTRLITRQTWRRAASRLKWLGVPVAEQTAVEVSTSPDQRRFRDSAYRALERYRPHLYPGRIHFVRAAIPTDFPADPAAVWSHLAPEFSVETVPGDHLGIMTTHFDQLGAAITRCLQEAQSK